MSLKNLAWWRKTENIFEFSVKILFSSPTLVVVTEKNTFFLNQRDQRCLYQGGYTDNIVRDFQQAGTSPFDPDVLQMTTL
jgi:hypothetical protein